MRRIYADWCDRPLPVLDDISPRAALATREGRERVRFILRSYEFNERDMAQRDQRPVVSFGYLWQELGLTREEA